MSGLHSEIPRSSRLGSGRLRSMSSDGVPVGMRREGEISPSAAAFWTYPCTKAGRRMLRPTPPTLKSAFFPRRIRIQ
ncbi:unnamed protein product, partial [Musa textilis]